MKYILRTMFGLCLISGVGAISYTCTAASYTDRQVSRAVETLVSKGAWAERKPVLQKLDRVIPAAKQKLANSPDALRILDQISLAVTEKLTICKSEDTHNAFAQYGLMTNTNTRSIPLDEILSGGPPKDGIPALTNPDFITIAQARERNFINDASEGIMVEHGNSAKYYPYNILNRHEIINDTVDISGEAGQKSLAVTFCPLCGTAIVFDREFDGSIVEFGVSGKLYNSNLLMYDQRSHSLRSQAMGKGVAGFYTDFQLEYADSSIMTLAEYEALHPDGLVLSDETGYDRNYRLDSPYGDYNSNENLYFPVSNVDSSLPKKTLLYVVNDVEQEASVAFVGSQLREAERASIIVDGVTYKAAYDDGVVVVTRDGTKLTTFTQMRFSWTAHENFDRHLWQAE